MSRSEKESLLSRWSRLKRESAGNGADAAQPSTPSDGAEPSPDVPADGRTSASEGVADGGLPELPPLDTLTADSDFQAFMDPRVEDGVRRAALKTLFRSPDFNLPDGLDVYAEDYTKLEKLTPAMVAALKYAQRTLFNSKEDACGDTGPASPDARRSHDENPSRARCGDEQHGHDQRDGSDFTTGESDTENIDGSVGATVPADGAGGAASETSSTAPSTTANQRTSPPGGSGNAITDEQAVGKRDE